MKICDIKINCLNRQDLFRHQSGVCIVVTVNAEAIVRSQSDSRLKEIISNSVSTIDGQVPLWLCMISKPCVKIEKLSGSDIIYDYCEWAELNGYKIFLLGGSNESNEGALIKLRLAYPNLLIEGYSPVYKPYPFEEEFNENILSRIAEARPDILFVGFGMGKQEFWAEDSLQELEGMGVKYVIGCGGTFDFVSGRIRRAPLNIQKMGLEGLWRFVVEPKFFRFKRLLMSSQILYFFLVIDIFKTKSIRDFFVYSYKKLKR